jgi:hypothetical protein
MSWGRPSQSESKLIHQNIEDSIKVIPDAVAGQWEKAMKLLHSN